MRTFDCKNCRANIELVSGLIECPVCLADVQAQVAEVLRLAKQSTIVPNPEPEPEVEFDLDDLDPDFDPDLDIEFEILEDVKDNDSEKLAASQASTLLDPQFGSDKKIDKTLGSAALTARPGQPEEQLDPLSTLVAPQQTQTPQTIINPAAAKEAAEIYSKGLKTVIPPRTVSREQTPSEIQDYKVEKRLGAGAFGVVFRALQVPLDRSVAVKVLNPEDVPDERLLKMKNEFLREAQFTGRLEHPNIVPVHDIGLTVNAEGRANPFYVMKEIRGKSWLETIRTESRRENLKIFKSVVNAIAFAHDRNILHCDLKPDNVMVGEFGEVLVVDWGQAVDLSMPETMRPGGTPAYISPEMARYWVDLHLEHKPHSEAQELVGFRSDVYLLGALLFEIVAKIPPHGGEDESAYQTIRRAAKNDVADYQRFANDELMQIALAALRLGDRKPIETVEDLSNAIKVYENRLSSIELRHRAYDVLATAKNNSDYDEFQRARFGFEESLEKWDGNALSQQGLRDARFSCAELALKDQNFDLGIGMLDQPETPKEKTLKQKLVEGKIKRDRRKKLVRYLALGLASSIIVGLGLNAFMINENFKTLKLRDVALLDKREAEKATLQAVEETRKAEQSTLLAEQKRQQAEQELFPLRKEIQEFPQRLKKAEAEYQVQLDQKLAEKQKEYVVELEAEQKKNERQLANEKIKLGDQLNQAKAQLAKRLDEEQAKFNAETATLVQQKEMLNQQVSDLNESSKLLRYKSGITNVVQKLQAGDYRETRRLLDGFADNKSWEVARLNLLAHREIEAIYPESKMESFAASSDGSRFAMVFDQQIEIRDTQQFGKPLLWIPIQGATAVALSSDGNRIAVAKPADSMLKPGTIWIVNISDPNSPVQEETLRAQSRTISKLEFSRDSERFLAVGVPSKLRKSSGSVMEKELMVWDRNWSPVNVELIRANGELPKFSSATFSPNGRRILTTNPTGLARDQVVHIFQQTSRAYRWSASSPSSGINVATFENPAATSVVGCQRDKESGTYSLVSWLVDGSGRATSPEFISSGPVSSASVRTVAPLEQKALSIGRYDDQLVTSGQDRQITIWDWKTKTPTSYGGHAHDVNFTALVPGGQYKENIWISVASGDKPEVLKTDLSKFETEVDQIQMGRVAANDQPSPSTLGFSRLTQQIALGNDLGQASVTRNADARNSQTIQWDVSAWKNHVLSSKFLFAQSRGDFVYKFNRSTGELESVLTRIASEFKNEIIKFEVSTDGRIALLVTSDTKPEFHLWDLRNDSKLRTIDYGAQNVFGTGSEKVLLALKLSPDGRFVIGGKVGLFAWSTETGERQQLTKPGPEMARGPVSSIEFINESSRFLVSWKDRIDRFDLNGGSERFNTKEVAYNKNEPNLFGAIEVGGRTLVLARSISKSNRNSGIQLLDLDSQTTIATFESARFASFSGSGSGDVIVVGKASTDKAQSDLANGIELLRSDPRKSSLVKKWSATTRRLEPIDIERALQNHFDGRFRVVEKAYQTNGKITLQMSNKNRNNSSRRDWNTVSIEPDMTVGPLRVIAKPKIDFHATVGDRAISLDSGTVRFWKLGATSVQPDGVLNGFFRSCALSDDEKTLIVVPHQSNRVIAIDPQTGQELYSIIASSESNVVAVDLSIDSRQIAIGFENGGLEIWNIGLGGGTELQHELAIDDSAIELVNFSDSGNSLLALAPGTGMAFVLHRNLEQWQRVGLGHIDGQEIVAADVSADGKRVVTGSREGRLTIWNSEVSQVAELAEPVEQNEERELYNLQNKHQSAISFVKFLSDESGESKIASADVSSGENSYLIWKSKRPR